METKEPKSKMWLLWLIIAAVVLSLVIFTSIRLTAKDYEKLISEKEQQIETLQKQADDYEAKMQDYKAKAKFFAEGIMKSSKKIDILKKDIQKQRTVVVKRPETTEETIRRLKEAGFDPKVECK